MSGNLTPDTNLALLNASQGDIGKTGKSLEQARKTRELSKIDEAAQEFEAVFVAEMMKPMFEGIDTGGMFGGGKGEEVFRSLLIQEYGKIISQTGSIGVADQVREEMIRMQEQIDNEHARAE